MTLYSLIIAITHSVSRWYSRRFEINAARPVSYLTASDQASLAVTMKTIMRGWIALPINAELEEN